MSPAGVAPFKWQKRRDSLCGISVVQTRESAAFPIQSPALRGFSYFHLFVIVGIDHVHKESLGGGLDVGRLTLHLGSGPCSSCAVLTPKLDWLMELPRGLKPHAVRAWT